VRWIDEGADVEHTRSEAALASAIARAIAPANDLEQLSRPLLELLERLTGLDSVYLTVVYWQDEKQEILFSHNSGKFDIPEGIIIDWKDTLCRRSLLEGRTVTPDVEAAWGFDHAAGELGYRSYVSVPVVTADRAIFGTLCAAGSTSRVLRDEDVQVMKLLARLMADQVDRDRAIERERARATAAEARTRDRALLMAAAEHKVKTPLTVVAGLASTLAGRWDEIAEPQRRELVERIDRRCDDLAQTVEAMLAEATADASSRDLRVTALYFGPELQAQADDFGAVSEHHELVVRCDPQLIGLADRGALRQVLAHLVDNAVRYSPGGTIELAAERAGDQVIITVADEGPGLPPGELFEPFVRGASGGDASGTGLGLHVVRSLVEAMRGTVGATTRASGGAVFRVVLAGC
jgi:signal transduction histidine kinase